MNEIILTLIQKQINAELTASYFYDMLAHKAKAFGWFGAYEFMREAAEEENGHARRMMNYLIAKKQPCVFESLSADISVLLETDPSEPELLSLFNAAYTKELAVSEMINYIITSAVERNDVHTQNFFDEFSMEQIKSEEELVNLLNRIKLAGDNQAALLLIDQELASKK